MLLFFSYRRKSLSYHIFEIIFHVFVDKLFYFSFYLKVVSLDWKTYLFELLATGWSRVFSQWPLPIVFYISLRVPKVSRITVSLSFFIDFLLNFLLDRCPAHIIFSTKLLRALCHPFLNSLYLFLHILLGLTIWSRLTVFFPFISSTYDHNFMLGSSQKSTLFESLLLLIYFKVGSIYWLNQGSSKFFVMFLIKWKCGISVLS